LCGGDADDGPGGRAGRGSRRGAEKPRREADEPPTASGQICHASVQTARTRAERCGARDAVHPGSRDAGRRGAAGLCGQRTVAHAHLSSETVNRERGDDVHEAGGEPTGHTATTSAKRRRARSDEADTQKARDCVHKQRNRQRQAQRATTANRETQRQKEHEAEHTRIHQEQAARRMPRREPQRQKQKEHAHTREARVRAREEREQKREQRRLWHEDMQRKRVARPRRQAERAARAPLCPWAPHQRRPRECRFSTLSLSLSSRLRSIPTRENNIARQNEL
jgi:hypothetical protein